MEFQIPKLRQQPLVAYRPCLSGDIIPGALAQFFPGFTHLRTESEIIGLRPPPTIPAKPIGFAVSADQAKFLRCFRTFGALLTRRDLTAPGYDLQTGNDAAFPVGKLVLIGGRRGSHESHGSYAGELFEAVREMEHLMLREIQDFCRDVKHSNYIF